MNEIFQYMAMSIVIMPIVNLSSLTKYTSSKCVYSLLNINIIAMLIRYDIHRNKNMLRFT